MIHPFFRATALLACTVGAAVWAPAVIATPAPLPTEIAAALDRAKLPREAFVAMVQEVGATRPRLALRADQPVNPASLMKLLTTFAGLELLGPAWSWTTPVWLQGDVKDGVLDGNLVIKGSGDPKLVLERMWLMMRRVQQAGVREIRGDIVLDRSAFVLPPHNPGEFDAEPYRPSNAGSDALLLNYRSLTFTFTPDVDRHVARVSVDLPLAGVRLDTEVALTSGPCADWRVALQPDFTDALRVRFTGTYAVTCGEKTWPVAYADPASYNERALAGLWNDLGGRLSGSVRSGLAPATLPTFELSSPSLAEVTRDINKFSNNVMAQQLFLTLGLTQRGSGTPQVAREVLRQWAVDRLGAASAGLIVDNGSGLSRDGRVTAQLLARLLQLAWASPVMPELMSSLPVSGLDGTLKRSRALPAPTARAHLKTGSLRDVTGVAGYVLANSGRRYVMVAIVNHANASAARPALEALVQWVANDAGQPRATIDTPD